MLTESDKDALFNEWFYIVIEYRIACLKEKGYTDDQIGRFKPEGSLYDVPVPKNSKRKEELATLSFQSAKEHFNNLWNTDKKQLFIDLRDAYENTKVLAEGSINTGKFSDEDRRFIEENYKEMSDLELSWRIDRRVRAVRDYRFAKGLSKNSKLE